MILHFSIHSWARFGWLAWTSQPVLINKPLWGQNISLMAMSSDVFYMYFQKKKKKKIVRTILKIFYYDLCFASALLILGGLLILKGIV